MFYSFLFLIILLNLKSQLNIDVYRLNSDRRSFDIEDRILEKLQDLHLRKTGEKLVFNIKKVSIFKDVLKRLHESKNNYAIGMSGISITNDRKENFDFSSPYIFITECILTLKKNKKTLPDNWKKENTLIGYTKGTTSEHRIKLLSEKYNSKGYAFDTVEERIKGLKEKKVNYIIGDDIYVWQHPILRKSFEFKNDIVTGYGIAFLKKSPLKKLLNPYLKYIIKSNDFRALMKKQYGKAYIDFYRKKF